LREKKMKTLITNLTSWILYGDDEKSDKLAYEWFFKSKNFLNWTINQLSNVYTCCIQNF
jgi:hypothetical protein